MARSLPPGLYNIHNGSSVATTVVMPQSARDYMYIIERNKNDLAYQLVTEDQRKEIKLQ